MNTPTDPYVNPPPLKDNALALSLTSAALLAFLCWQIIHVTKNHSALRAQQKQRGELVDQSLKVQTDLQKLANDLVELAKTDPEAKILVDRFQIKVAPPPQPAQP